MLNSDLFSNPHSSFYIDNKMFFINKSMNESKMKILRHIALKIVHLSRIDLGSEESSGDVGNNARNEVLRKIDKELYCPKIKKNIIISPLGINKKRRSGKRLCILGRSQNSLLLNTNPRRVGFL